jgi:hypothetical protein
LIVYPEDIVAHGWRVSPLAAGVCLGREEMEPYDHVPHLKILSDAIVDGVTGAGSKFIIVSMPPRHGKSMTVSKWTPTWYLGNWPQKKAMITGYGASFAKDWGRLVRNLCNKHQDRLGFTLADDSKAVDSWHTEHGGGMCTAGVGGPITGKGADLLIIDDPIKNAEEAFSSTYREALWKWYTTTARTRLHPGGVLVVVMTRWHTDDLVGRLLNEEYSDPSVWRVINFPAVWEQSEPDLLGRSKGEALWPARYDIGSLLALKRGMSPEDWLALYQQVPINTAGIGNVYQAFHDVSNVGLLERDPRLPLVWSLDFNVDPMASVIAQYREEMTERTRLTNEVLKSSDVLDELVLPSSNTPEALEEFYSRVKERGWLRAQSGTLQLHIFGDVSGNQRNTVGSPSDWELIKQFMKKKSDLSATFHVGRSNPTVRDRVNAVNAALRSADGDRRLMVHSRCKELRKDLQEVRWKKDAAGNSTSQIDKSDPKRTHVSDALGYFIYTKFALRATAGEMSGVVR